MSLIKGCLSRTAATAADMDAARAEHHATGPSVADLARAVESARNLVTIRAGIVHDMRRSGDFEDDSPMLAAALDALDDAVDALDAAEMAADQARSS